MLWQVTVRGIYQQTIQCPVIRVKVHYLQQDHSLDVLVSDDLLYPLFLGQGEPVSNMLVQRAIQEESPASSTS